MKKKILLITFITLSSFSCIACNKEVSLSSAVFGDGGNEIVGTMTLLEYDLKVNRLIATVFNDAETHLSNSKYVVAGTMEAKEESTLVSKTLTQTQEVINTIDKLAEPENRTENKTSLILALTNYKFSLTNYYDALNKEDTNEIKNAASVMMQCLETLKENWSSYTE